MITHFELNYDLEREMNAVMLCEADVAESNEVPVQLYIPTIMPQIKQGEPEVSILNTAGYSVFRNTVLRPKLSSPGFLYEKNFLETCVNHEANVDDMSNSTFFINNLVNQSMIQLAKLNKLKCQLYYKKVEYKINIGMIVRAQFMNGKITKLAYTFEEESQSDRSLITNPELIDVDLGEPEGEILEFG